MTKTPIPPTSPLQFRRTLQDRYDAVVAIPCCHELDSLPETLNSLEANDSGLLDRTLALINVNQRASMDRHQNLETLQWLADFDTSLNLAWLDHASGEAAYPEKFGVGLARHQACSAGLPFLDDAAPVISLDADSPVSPNYLRAIFSFVNERPDFDAGHVNFRHRRDGTPAENRAIEIYEQHLHRHRRLLAEARSPHAWYAIGSTIVCTKAAYQKAGGYHCRRMAGEDFYLLQQLSKTGCTIQMIEDAFVYPSARRSARVPFGTGSAVGKIIQQRHWLTYHENCYRDLGQLLNTVGQNLSASAREIMDLSPSAIQPWLQERRFADVWPNLQANAPDDTILLQQFHRWLDAFQTLKLIHFLSDHHYRRCAIGLLRKTLP